MKYTENILKRSLIISIIFLFSLGLTVDVFAFGTLFHHEKVAEEDKERVYGYLEMKYISEKSTGNDRIECFDISQDDTLMAVGYSSDKIGVYDTDGNWKWGVQIIGAQQGVACELDDEDNNLLIFFQRSNRIYKVDANLNIIDVVSYNTKANGEIYPNLELSRAKIRDDKKYDMSWTRIWVEEDGEKRNLIKNSSFSVIAIIVILIIFVTIFFNVKLLNNIIKNKGLR